MYALGLTLWEKCGTCPPEPGYRPRAKPMRSQIMFDVPSGLSVDEVKQIFRCLGDDPSSRPSARHLRFFNPSSLTTSQVQIPRERINPGAPPGRSGASEAFVPGGQSLLVTYCTNAPDAAGMMFSLEKPMLTIGRRAGQDIVMPEATVSGAHAVLRCQNGSWTIEDVGSTNGTYADHSYERKKTVAVLHGAELQLGESRVKLVSFQDRSPQHERARADLLAARRLDRFVSARRNGAGDRRRTRLRRVVERSLGDRALSHSRPESPRQRAAYHLGDVGAAPRCPARARADRNAAAQVRFVLTAGRTGPLKFAVAMTGPSLEEARNVVEQVVSQVQGLMPEALDLAATLVRAEPGQNVHALLDD